MRRVHQPELLDGELAPSEHHAALEGLARVNLVSRTVPALWRTLEPLARQAGTRLRVLDIACGGGDVAVGLWQAARRAGLDVVVEGCDGHPVAVQHAGARAERAGAPLRFFTQRLAAGETLPEGYDVVLCTLLLHHLDEDAAVSLLASMSAAASRMVVVDDLSRDPLGWLLAWAGTRLVCPSPVVHHDGPLSVRRAYTLREVARLAQRAGLRGARVQRHWPRRFQLVWRPAS